MRDLKGATTGVDNQTGAFPTDENDPRSSDQQRADQARERQDRTLTERRNFQNPDLTYHGQPILNSTILREHVTPPTPTAPVEKAPSSVYHYTSDEDPFPPTPGVLTPPAMRPSSHAPRKSHPIVKFRPRNVRDKIFRRQTVDNTSPPPSYQSPDDSDPEPPPNRHATYNNQPMTLEETRKNFHIIQAQMNSAQAAVQALQQQEDLGEEASLLAQKTAARTLEDLHHSVENLQLIPLADPSSHHASGRDLTRAGSLEGGFYPTLP